MMNKMLKKIFIFIIINISIFTMFINFVDINAHNNLLIVQYDSCVNDKDLDGEDEVWYYIQDSLFNASGSANIDDDYVISEVSNC